MPKCWVCANSPPSANEIAVHETRLKWVLKAQLVHPQVSWMHRAHISASSPPCVSLYLWSHEKLPVTNQLRKNETGIWFPGTSACAGPPFQKNAAGRQLCSEILKAAHLLVYFCLGRKYGQRHGFTT